MGTEPKARRAAPGDYWDLPEIALLLRVVFHVNIGATLAIACWLATQAFSDGGISALFGRNVGAVQPACNCELQLTPLSPGRKLIVQAQNGGALR